MPITSIEDNAQRRLEFKARSTLIMGIPNEHQLKFNSIKDAKQLMEAIKKRFGGNAATKKTHRNLLKQQYENFTALNSEMLDQTQKVVKKLVARIDTHDVVWRNKADLDTMSMDNIYNNLKIHPDDLEEINLKWQIAVLTMRAERFLKKTRRKLTVNGNKTIGFDKTNMECYNCHKRGHFPRECKALRSQDTKHKESTRRTMLVKTPASTALVSCDSLGGYD
nr:ribonuclease H-like domain-containing protein [Tanacetum cinerariifolium]